MENIFVFDRHIVATCVFEACISELDTSMQDFWVVSTNVEDSAVISDSLSDITTCIYSQNLLFCPCLIYFNANSTENGRDLCNLAKPCSATDETGSSESD